MIKLILNLSFFLLITNLNFGQKTADEYFNIAEKADLNNHQLKIDNYSKAIELNPSMSEAYFKRGLSKEILGIKDACDDFYKSCGLGYINACNKYNYTKNSNCRIKFKDKISPRFGISSAYGTGNTIDLRITTFPKKSTGFYFEYNYSNYDFYRGNLVIDQNGFFPQHYEGSWYNFYYQPMTSDNGIISSIDAYGEDMTSHFPNGGLKHGEEVKTEVFDYYGNYQIGITQNINNFMWISIGLGYIDGLEVFELRDYFNASNNLPYGQDWFYNSDRSTGAYYTIGNSSPVSFHFSSEFIIKKYLILRYEMSYFSQLIVHDFGVGITFKTPKRKTRKI